MKLVMDLVVNHTSDEHPWFVESRSTRQPEARLVLVAARPRRAWRRVRPGAEPTNWGSFFGGSAWEFDEATGEYYLHLFSQKQPDLNWENPEVRAAVYEMMRWWLDRGVDGFRMDVINMISKDTALPDGPVLHGGLFGDGSPFYIAARASTSSCRRCTARSSPAARTCCSPSARCPASPWTTPSCSPTPPGARWTWCSSSSTSALDHGPGDKWDIRPLDLLDLKASLGRWQAGLAERGWNSLYWDNHDQPRAVSRFGDDGEYRVQSAKMLATVLHLHRGTPYVYQGEELGMTNVPFAGSAISGTSNRSTTIAEAVGRGRRPEPVLAALRLLSRDNARTPMQWDASAARRLHHRAPWIAVNPNYQPHQRRRRRWTIRTRCSRISGRVIALRHANRWSRTATSPCCCRMDRRSMPSPATTAVSRCWWSPTSPPTQVRANVPDEDRLGQERTGPGKLPGRDRAVECAGRSNPAATVGGADLPRPAVTAIRVGPSEGCRARTIVG